MIQFTEFSSCVPDTDHPVCVSCIYCCYVVHLVICVLYSVLRLISHQCWFHNSASTPALFWASTISNMLPSTINHRPRDYLKRLSISQQRQSIDVGPGLFYRTIENTTSVTAAITFLMTQPSRYTVKISL